VEMSEDLENGEDLGALLLYWCFTVISDVLIDCMASQVIRNMHLEPLIAILSV